MQAENKGAMDQFPSDTEMKLMLEILRMQRVAGGASANTLSLQNTDVDIETALKQK